MFHAKYGTTVPIVNNLGGKAPWLCGWIYTSHGQHSTNLPFHNISMLQSHPVQREIYRSLVREFEVLSMRYSRSALLTQMPDGNISSYLQRPSGNFRGTYWYSFDCFITQLILGGIASSSRSSLRRTIYISAYSSPIYAKLDSCSLLCLLCWSVSSGFLK